MGMIGGILGLVGGVVQAAGAAEMGSYEAQVARNNAQIAEENAQRATEAGWVQATNESRAVAAKEASVTVGEAASGVDINTGSAADVRAGTRETGKEDTETTLWNAMMKAYGYRTQEYNYQAQAGQDELAGSIGAASGILSGIGSFAGQASSLPFGFGGGGGGGSFAGPSADVSVPATADVSTPYVSGDVIPSYGTMPGTGWPA